MSKRGKQGRRGESVTGPRGEKGAKGEKGDSALEIVSWCCDVASYRLEWHASTGVGFAPVSRKISGRSFRRAGGSTEAGVTAAALAVLTL